MPCMKFLFVRSDVCRQLPSDFTLRWTPLLLAIQFPLLGLARDFHPLDNAHAERTESERNAVSQAQWRSAQNLSFSSLQRLTALSFDSCVFTFGGVDTSATPQCSDFSYPSGKPLSNDKAKPPSYHGKPSAIRYGKPSSLRLYGLHLSQEEKEESAAAQQVEDSIAIAKQSSSDKSQEIIKSRSSVPFTAKLAIAVLMMITAVAVIFFIRRYLAGRRRHFGHRLPNSLPGSSGGALFGGEDKPLQG